MAIHLGNRRLVASDAIGFAVLFSLVATLTYVNFYLAAPPFRLSPAALGTVFMVYLVGVVVTPLSGSWIRRFGRRAAVTAGIACSVAGLLMTLASTLPVVIAALALCATGVFVFQAAATSFLSVAATEAGASAIGVSIPCYYAGGNL